MSDNKSQAQEIIISELIDKTGWSREYTIAQLDDAKRRLDITYSDYNKYNFFAIPIEEQAAKYIKRIKLNARKKVEEEKNKSIAIAKIMVATGWTYSEAETKVLEAQRRTGVTYREYFFYHFYELDEATQSNVFIASNSNKIKKKFDINRESIALTYDKGRTNTYFEKYLKRPWCINTQIAQDDFVSMFKNSKRIFYKPIKGGGGRSVCAYNINPSNAADLYNELSTMPEALIEEQIIQHPKMNLLCDSSVNTLRIATISSYTQDVTPDGKHLDIAYAAVRVGGGTSVVDNFHSGGMVAAIDMDTGVVITHAADAEGRCYVTHPVTGTVFKNFEIPYFAEAIDLVRDACITSKIEGYIGWDIAISEAGPVLVEVNHNPGAMLLTAPYITEKRGMKHVMDKYLF